MILDSIELTHFRSYKKHKFQFSPEITIIIGPNTAGKTNILEAIFLLSTGKSFRAGESTEMIREGKELSVISCQLSDISGKKDLEVRLTTGEVAGQKASIKRFLVNGVPRRSIDFVGNLRSVLFWPEDLELITDSPSIRRRYLDFVLVQVDREYRRSLASYEKGVRQRNKLLERIRDEGVSHSQLLFWDQLLIRTGNYLTDKRIQFIDAINASDKPFGDFNIIYDKSIISANRLSFYEREEVASATTLVGPHRDDLQFFENKRDLSKYGSRGEQRLAILWLKLAELTYIEKETSEKPILLLDDIFSELDHGHRKEIEKIVGSQQTIITTTDMHFLPKGYEKWGEVIELTGDKKQVTSDKK